MRSLLTCFVGFGLVALALNGIASAQQNISYYETTAYGSPTGGTLSKFGHSISMRTEFIVVGSPDTKINAGPRAGSASIFNVYSQDAVDTVSTAIFLAI